MFKPLNVPSSGSKKLIELITQYNEITDGEEQAELKRLFYLQKINHLSKYSAENATIQWRNQLKEDGLEFHLQHYGIHRDASQLVQSIEFANAVCSLASKVFLPNKSKEDFYEAAQERDRLFSGDADVDSIGTYIEYNQTIMAYYEQNS